ncbi:T9SS type A sorting domain-containing protein [Flavobacterium sp. CS20]|uniref:T9SS type A sorting domain-containing protein n=1 Tax=Flavobacterium sp. CS20 TaxID=2775246 RepID=UPI001B3A3541|nr:T9SS type A sorting domain-containing protein [Flavobacterium sp. CS20]QTY26719.1 T9SS type A sorting domain-containing protein [Flavobacterium sp. CS20]
MKTLFLSIILLISISLKAQIAPFTDHDWTIEKIETFNGTTILADVNENGDYDKMYIFFEDFIFVGYTYIFSECQGFFNFNDSNQSFEILYFGCAITPNPPHTIIADHFVNVFILQEGGETQTPEGPVYGPFSYDFTYSGGLVYLHITNLAGSVATFYANNLSQEEFLKESISIYPNPAKDVLHVESSTIAIESLRIYNLSGRLVSEKGKIEHQINVSQLQQGVYILEIETVAGVLRDKLVKK